MMGFEFSDDNFEKISNFVYRKTGIALEKDKHFDKVRKKIDSRCKALDMEDFRKYFFFIRFDDKSGDEFQELINALTVNETYFFREKEQFEVLVSDILPQIHSLKSAQEPIRILCAPSSSGEEPYSVALYVLEEGNIINSRDIEIIGIDIDNQIIDKAKKGLYNDRSLHAIPNELKNRYFKKKMGFYEMDRDIADAITFKVVNVFDKNAMRKLGKFDIIFSRNMLIYFDDASRKEVAMTFYEMLNDSGFILLGHAEYMSRIVSVFKPLKINNTLLYQK